MSQTSFQTPTNKIVLSISQLNQQSRNLLEGALSRIWVEGEISNFVRPSSGHMYLTLKDDQSQIRAAMFRGQNQGLSFTPKNGQLVQVRGKVSLYAPRGDYQLIIDHMEEAGEGALRREFEQLKQRLSEQGLFDPAHKKDLPDIPKHIGVITSPTGAAVRDILSVLKRRFPAAKVTLIPVAVQGDKAKTEIVHALDRADNFNQGQELPIELIILGRGGGSLEDLWAFNEEIVAQAIYRCKIPIVSAVGHEIDFTIADFVADLRAPTPSAAAELVSPDQQELQQRIQDFEQFFVSTIQTQLVQQQQKLTWLQKRLKHPGQRLRDHQQRLDELDSRLHNAIQNALQLKKTQLRASHTNLLRVTPTHRITQLKNQQNNLKHRLLLALQNSNQHAQQHISQLAQRMHAISPLATLARGYAIVSDPDKNIIRTSEQLQVGQLIETQLHQGHVVSEVKRIKKK
ncbi:MAG: exodeoxyribonuclease VII large subunit [Gammaproteobacteria bacterium]|nr:MAG: exodeoxyribonuclease VII large subunit [Gammaproteobacteria bacterium]